MEENKEHINYSKMSEASALKIEEAKKQEETAKMTPPVKPKDNKIQEIEPYFATVSIKKLNVRKGPSKNSSVSSIISSGAFVKIVAEKESNDATWGKIEGQGWINLAFIKRK